MEEESTSKYRKYLSNPSVPVPKTTIWRHRKRAGSKRALWGKSSTSFKAQKHAKPGNVEPDASSTSSDSCAASVKYGNNVYCHVLT